MPLARDKGNEYETDKILNFRNLKGCLSWGRHSQTLLFLAKPAKFVLVRCMAKECSECGSVVNNEAPYCEACGGQSWRPTQGQQGRTQQVIAGVIFILVLAGIYWYYTHPH